MFAFAKSKLEEIEERITALTVERNALKKLIYEYEQSLKPENVKAKTSNESMESRLKSKTIIAAETAADLSRKLGRAVSAGEVERALQENGHEVENVGTILAHACGHKTNPIVRKAGHGLFEANESSE